METFDETRVAFVSAFTCVLCAASGFIWELSEVQSNSGHTAQNTHTFTKKQRVGESA